MFGGFGGMHQRYLQEKELANTLPKRKVSKTEFIKCCKAAGLDSKQALLQASISTAFNTGGEAWAHIGNEMLAIKVRKPKEKK